MTLRSPGSAYGASETNSRLAVSTSLTLPATLLSIAEIIASVTGAATLTRNLVKAADTRSAAVQPETKEEGLKYEIHGNAVHFVYRGIPYQITQPIPEQCALGKIEYSESNGLNIPVTFRAMMVEKKGTVKIDAAFIENALKDLHEDNSESRMVFVPYELVPEDENDTALVEFLFQTGVLSKPMLITLKRTPRADPSSLAYATKTDGHHRSP